MRMLPLILLIVLVLFITCQGKTICIFGGRVAQPGMHGSTTLDHIKLI